MLKLLENKKILVTGSHGFLGQHIMATLLKHGATNITTPSFAEADLRKLDACKSVVEGKDIVIHLAGNIGGIGLNASKPAELLYDNLLMGIQLMDEARKAGVSKMVVIGTPCEYPKFAHLPLKEECVWDGYPEPVTAPYGLAKRMLLLQGQIYREQYSFNAIHLIPSNMYGAYDDFTPVRSHVIPALIRRIYKAKLNNSKTVDIWGSGNATREFVYAPDAAEGIIQATERYNGSMPLNISSGKETSIKELVSIITNIIGYEGEIHWDASKPDGYARRWLDVSRAERELGFRAKTGLEEGLKETVEWYTNSLK